MANEGEIEARFWKDIKGSPFVMLGLDGARDGHTQPMAVHSDGDGGPFYIFTTKDNGLVEALSTSDRAIATYASKGHDLFASIHGSLAVDTDRAKVDKYWNSHVAAWYDQGKDDPRLCLLRFDTERAMLWENANDVGAAIRSLLGRDPKEDYKDKITEVTL